MHHWLDLLFPPREDERIVRRVAEADFCALLAPRLVDATRPATTVLLPFAHKEVRPVLHEAKYHYNRKAHALLASVLRAYLRDADLDLSRTVLVPIPLGEGRSRERGFNQAEEIARRALAGTPGQLEARLLARTRETASQVSLKREERALNLLGAFTALRPVDPALTYLVFDDTITTGATLQAALDALSEAGARHLVPLALAH